MITPELFYMYTVKSIKMIFDDFTHIVGDFQPEKCFTDSTRVDIDETMFAKPCKECFQP